MEMTSYFSRFDNTLLVAIGGFVGFFATWTILCNIGVQIGMTSDVLIPLFLLSAVAGIASGAKVRTLDLQLNTTFGTSSFGLNTAYSASLIPASFICVGAITFYATKNFSVFWFLALTGIALGLWKTQALRPEGTATGGNSSPSQLDTFAFFALLLLAVSITLLVQRPDADDANFLNLSVGILYDPRPILTWDTMIESQNQVIHLPTYRVESLPILFAAMARLTGLPVIWIAHVFWPSFAAGMLVAVYALFARTMTPTRWFFVAALSLTWLLLNSSAHSSHGNFGLVRLQQGKGFAYSILVPVIYIFAIHFYRSRSLGTWLLIFGTQVSMIGMTANGIFLAPLTIFLAMTSLLVVGPFDLRGYLLGGCAGLWPVAMGVVIIATTGAFPSEHTETTPIFKDAVRIFGANAYGLFALIIGFSLWTFTKARSLRLFFGAALLFVLLFAFNPLLSSFMAKHVTGNLNFRLLYSIPFPLFVGTSLAFLLPSAWQKTSIIYIAVIGALLLGVLSPVSTLRSWNGTNFAPFGLKVVPEDYEIATSIAGETDSNSITLAPERIAVWLSSSEPPRRLIAVRQLYMAHYRHTMPLSDVELRSALLSYISGETRPENPKNALDVAVSKFHLNTIVLSDDNPWFAEIKNESSKIGFKEQRLSNEKGWTIMKLQNDHLTQWNF